MSLDENRLGPRNGTKQDWTIFYYNFYFRTRSLLKRFERCHSPIILKRVWSSKWDTVEGYSVSETRSFPLLHFVIMTIKQYLKSTVLNLGMKKESYFPTTMSLTTSYSTLDYNITPILILEVMGCLDLNLGSRSFMIEPLKFLQLEDQKSKERIFLPLSLLGGLNFWTFLIYRTHKLCGSWYILCLTCKSFHHYKMSQSFHSNLVL